MRMRPDKKRRWRVSVYAPGVTDPASYPLIHKASRSQDIAQEHFNRFAAQIGQGKIGRVILHQGKLYSGYCAYIHTDTDWFKNTGKYQPSPTN